MPDDAIKKRNAHQRLLRREEVDPFKFRFFEGHLHKGAVDLHRADRAAFENAIDEFLIAKIGVDEREALEVLAFVFIEVELLLIKIAHTV